MGYFYGSFYHCTKRDWALFRKYFDTECSRWTPLKVSSIRSIIEEFQTDILWDRIEERRRQETNEWDQVMSQIPVLQRIGKGGAENRPLRSTIFSTNRKEKEKAIAADATRECRVFYQNIINMVSARSVDSEYNINPRKCKKDYSQSRVHLFVAEVRN